eukprot:jgi/Undpi1/887/HiC_scaffold_10.g04351.m1
MEPEPVPYPGGYTLALFGLGLALGVLTIRVRHQQKLEERNAGGEIVVTQDFKNFQTTFMKVYLLALLTEWFQAAYLFVLLREYHPEGFVVRMYLAGVASQLSLSVLLEVVGGFVPHKLRCAACLALQAGSAMLLVHPAFGGLVTSRVLAGFAASLLHSSFEAWMVEQHVGQGFPLDWFTHTFNRLSVAMSFLALAVGPPVTAAFELAGGPLGPFKISLLLVGLNGLLLLSWRRDSHKPCPACADVGRLWSRAFSAVVGEGGSRIALVAVAQGCFEAATFAFALLWTPLLTRPDVSMDMGSTQQPPWGMVFSQQLVCVMIGSVVYKLATSLAPATVTAEGMCLLASVGGACCFFAISTRQLEHLGVQCALLGYEMCVGIYLNAMGVMRSSYIPQEVRGLVLTVSKLFITTTLFVFLMYMSESRSAATGMCGALLSIAGICSAQAASRRDAAGEGQSGGSGGSGSSRGGGEDEEEDAVLLSQKR